MESFSETERWRYQLNGQLLKLHNVQQNLSGSDSLSILNALGVGYIKLSLADSALFYLNRALLLAQRITEAELQGSIINNLGSAYKLKKNFTQAKNWLYKSWAFNRALNGDSTDVLAYTYYHLADIYSQTGAADSTLHYLNKSEPIIKKHQLAGLQDDIKALRQKMNMTGKD